VVPVYELGAFPDARPYFTMKLVKGRTLAALLEGRQDPTEDLPRILAIFEQVCQTIAYAHARGVIHRDLKPSNVMVGAFGEVQVMDWGLAKVGARQSSDDTAETAEAGQSVIRTARSESDADASLAGSVLGTPAYMAPEQASGELHCIHARVDVFGLGAILCQILTGDPAYTGRTRREVLRKAALGDLADARSRLDGCAADGELIALAKACLSAEPQDRPADAGVVAAAMTAYQGGVQRRLRAAELAQVEAEARAERERAVAAHERRARRLTAVLAGSLILTAAVVAATWRWIEHDRATRASALADRVGRALQEATRLRGQAQRSATGELSVWAEAVAAARHAREFLGDGGDAALRRQVDGLLTTLRAEEAAAREESRAAAADRRLLDRLTDVRSAREDDLYG
jgi:serine/threonine-protein kinase